MVKKLLTASALTLTLCALSNAAYIDFTNPVFSDADGKTSYTVSDYEGTGIGVTLTASPEGSTLTYNVGFFSGYDGIGIDGTKGSDDEINGTEVLYVQFEKAVDLTEIDITDLYTEGSIFNIYQEVGFYKVDGSVEWISFSADLNDWQIFSNGEKSLTVDYTNITGISFKAGSSSKDDFSLKGLEVNLSAVSDVPEAGIVSLLGMGVLALSGAGLIRKKK